MACASSSMLDGGGTSCDEGRFPVHGCLGSRDVDVVCGVIDCVKEMSFVM